MFDAKSNAKIGKLNPRVIMENDSPRRITELTLHYELDDALAAGLGDVGKDALKHLRSGAQKSANILFDNVQVNASFDAGDKDKHALEMVGVRCAASRPKKEDASPKLKVLLAFATKHESLNWLADHMDQDVEVKLVRKQLKLAGV